MGGLVGTTGLADGGSVPKKWQLAWPTPISKPGCPEPEVEALFMDGGQTGWGWDLKTQIK